MEENFEVRIAAWMKPPRDVGDPLDLIEARDAVEVLIERPEESDQRVVQPGRESTVKRSMRALIFAFATFAAASSAHAGLLGGCDDSAPRNVSAPAAGITRVVIVGRAGFLHIEGRNGASEVRAEGLA